MSYPIEIRVTCECGRTDLLHDVAPHVLMTPDEAKRLAWGHGWTFVDGRARCPDCESSALV